MKKLVTLAVSVALLLIFVFPIWAKEDPQESKDKGPLSKITFIHYRKGFGRDTAKPTNGKGISCYGFLGKGVIWKTLPQTIYINSQNNDGLSASFINSVIDTSTLTWDAATIAGLYSNSIKDAMANWDDVTPDYKNEISFGNYPNNGVIAVTNIWGYFGGPIYTREIVEFDILFNEHYQWGNAELNPAVMDLQNIATHEIGHGWGLDDIYNSSCSAVTMYGYSDYGETSKRTLEPADINGIKSLYN